MDAKPWSICLSFAGRRRHSHSHSHSNTDRDSNANSHCDGNGNGDPDTETYPLTEGYTDAEAASYAAAATIARKLATTSNQVQPR